MSTPLATLVTDRLATLSLTLPELAGRLGYANMSKGSRRVQRLMAGDIIGQHEILSRLAAALKVPPEAVANAVDATKAAREEAHRAAFVPHAIIVTERTVPSQITFCALTRGEAALRIDLDAARPRSSFARQALVELNRRTDFGRTEVPFFGRALGFVVNYDPRRSIQFDLAGSAMQLLRREAQVGKSSWSVR